MEIGVCIVGGPRINCSQFLSTLRDKLAAQETVATQTRCQRCGSDMQLYSGSRDMLTQSLERTTVLCWECCVAFQRYLEMSGSTLQTKDGTPVRSVTQYRVRCSDCGVVYLTDSQYQRQMLRADDVWRCETCGAPAEFDDEWYDQTA